MNAIPEELLPKEGAGRDELRRLYSWILEEALEAQRQWDKEEHAGEFEAGPLHRWLAAQELKDWYEAHRKGHKGAILEAFYLCSLRSLPIPKWCSLAYLEAYRKVRHYKARSWDDVFGRPHPKNTKIEAKADERKKSVAVYNRILEMLQKEPETAIDDGLFEKVGKEFGLCKTLANRYYYKWKNRWKNKLP